MNDGGQSNRMDAAKGSPACEATSTYSTAIVKVADDLATRLQPTRPGTVLPTALTRLHGNDLFHGTVGLRCPPSRQRMPTSRSRSPPAYGIKHRTYKKT